ALQRIVDGGSRSAYPFPGFRHRASLASPYLPSSLAGEALPPPSDIGPGPRAERDFNPPDASTVRHTLWRGPTSRVRSSSATVPHLPDTDRPSHATLTARHETSQL